MTSDDGRTRSQFKLAALYYNSFLTAAPYAKSTGFRTNSLRHSTMERSDLNRVAEEFLINSRLERYDRETEISIEEYFGDTGLTMLSMVGDEFRLPPEDEEPTGKIIPLPKSIKLPLGFSQTVAHRRSQRAFTGDYWSLVEMATLLRNVGGITAKATVPLMSPGNVEFSFRASPSGGGVYSVELQIIALRVDGLERGIYRFDPLGDRLVQTKGDQAVDQFLDSSTVPEELISIRQSVAIIALVGRPWMAMRKYGARGLRLSFLEAGAMAEHVNLATTALGHGSVDCASFIDCEAHDAMGIDGQYQALLHTVIVGCGG